MNSLSVSSRRVQSKQPTQFPDLASWRYRRFSVARDGSTVNRSDLFSYEPSEKNTMVDKTGAMVCSPVTLGLPSLTTRRAFMVCSLPGVTRPGAGLVV
jgi:hypothetical protein